MVGPGAELELTALVVEWKPRDVNLARRLENPRGDLVDPPVVVDHNVGGEGGVKGLAGAVVQQQVGLPHPDRWNSDVLKVCSSELRLCLYIIYFILDIFKIGIWFNGLDLMKL